VFPTNTTRSTSTHTALSLTWKTIEHVPFFSSIQVRLLSKVQCWTALLTECAITADLDELESNVAIFKENPGLYCMRTASGKEMVNNSPRHVICLLLSFNGRSFGTEGGPQRTR
jgi:hypothetical protein